MLCYVLKRLHVVKGGSLCGCVRGVLCYVMLICVVLCVRCYSIPFKVVVFVFVFVYVLALCFVVRCCVVM